MSGSSDIWTKESVLGGKLGGRAAWLQKETSTKMEVLWVFWCQKSWSQYLVVECCSPSSYVYQRLEAGSGPSQCLRWRCKPSGKRGSWWCQNSCWSHLAGEQPDIRPDRLVHRNWGLGWELFLAFQWLWRSFAWLEFAWKIKMWSW